MAFLMGYHDLWTSRHGFIGNWKVAWARVASFESWRQSSILRQAYDVDQQPIKESQGHFLSLEDIINTKTGARCAKRNNYTVSIP